MIWLSIKEFLLDSMKFIIAILIILILIIYVFSVTQVVGNSMYNTLENGDILILNKFKYRVSDIKRGDIVSLEYADTKYLIKRIVGMPGERITIKDNKLYIDGKLYKEDYLNPNLEYEDYDMTKVTGYDKIPDNMYLVLGDNREDSLDSRDSKVGLINKSEINGKISLRFWPLNKIKFF